MIMKLPLKHDTRYAQHFAEAYSEPCQTSEMKLIAKTVNDFKLLKTAIGTRSTLRVWQGSEHTSSFVKLYI